MPDLKYKVAVAKYSSGLEGLVNALMAEGWSLHGGISMCEVEDDENPNQRILMFSQAMIRVEKKN